MPGNTIPVSRVWKCGGTGVINLNLNSDWAWQYQIIWILSFVTDMRKVIICPQTRFCGFEMSTLFAMNDGQFKNVDHKKKKV